MEIFFFFNVDFDDFFYYLFIHLFIFIVEKYNISRDDIIMGGILGEGFFGEVHNGVYKSQVRFFI